MDSEAVPAKFAVVGVEAKWLVGVLDGRQADVAPAVLTGFTITFEINSIHISEQILA